MASLSPGAQRAATPVQRLRVRFFFDKWLKQGNYETNPISPK
jgi:hypothetical protein